MTPKRFLQRFLSLLLSWAIVILIVSNQFLLTYFFKPMGQQARTQQTSIHTALASIISGSPEDMARRKEQNAQFYEDLQAKFNELATVQTGAVAISYLDLTTGKALNVNGDTPFVAASCIKVPLAMLVSDAIKAGELSWDQKLTFSESEREAGTGILNPQAGDQFSIEELMKVSITHSDNIAKNMLFNAIAPTQAEGFEKMFAAYLPDAQVFTDYQFTANDLANILQFLMNHKSENEGYQKIFDWMKETVFEERLHTPNTQDNVAHKIGSWETFFNDMGVFSGKHPYILVVMTNELGETNALNHISDISDTVWQFTQDHNSY